MSTSLLNDKTILVTGATAGIGKETAQELAKLGGHVVLVGRNAQKMQATLQEIQQETQGKGKLDALIGDLSSLAGIQSVADQFKEKYDRLDVLLNNAGGFFSKRLESLDGYEMTLALNHLNYFYLTNQLLGVLKQTPKARIVNVSSSAHYGCRVNFSDLQRKKFYNGWQVYSESKLMNIYFTRVLAQKLAGSGLTVNALHPGFVATNFGHGKDLFAWMIRISQRILAISPQKGALTSIYLASSGDVEGVTGKYFHKCRQQTPSSAAHDEKAANRLWEVSEDLIRQSNQLIAEHGVPESYPRSAETQI